MEFSLEQRATLAATIREAGGRLKVRGALNPILWLCGLVAAPCIAALAWNKDAPIIISVILCVVVGTAIVGFLWLLFFDRDRLHSEEYLIRSRTLDLIEEKGSAHAILAASAQAISQTDFLALLERKQGEGT